MCVGLPMQVQEVTEHAARVCGRGEEREVTLALVGPCRVGEWLLVSQDVAREKLSAERATEINAALDLLEAALAGDFTRATNDEPGFALPSALNAAELRALTGTPR
jgi:hydrogenase expression/formation protein HypC